MVDLAVLRERIERRLTWLREWHKLDRRQFTDGNGDWSAFDFCNDVERFLSHLPTDPRP